jgi:hypothetical protein
MKFFAPNIGRAGRVLRAAFGLACIVAGILLSGHSLWLGMVLVAGGIFGLFEAARGWCLARACGIKTKL